MKTYKATVNFGGYIGADLEYIISIGDDKDEDDAREEARELAMDDISIELELIDDEEEED